MLTEYEKQISDWIQWKRYHRETCDYLLCREIGVWYLQKNEIYYCAEHGGKEHLKELYLEEPILARNICPCCHGTGIAKSGGSTN